MNDSNPSNIEVICKQIFDEFSGVLSWKWDDWVGTVLAEFDAGKKEDVGAILGKFLPISWDSANIDTAPQIIQELDEHLGGLSPTQLLLNSDPTDNAFVFCAWWPWGDGKTISLRVAPFDKKSSDAEMAELIKLFKGWFGL